MSPNTPSVLIITRNFPPLTGGMERLMQYTAESLATQFDVTLIGPRGSGAFCPGANRVIECPTSPVLFLLVAMFKGWLHCMGRRYDIVFGGSGLVAPISAILARLRGSRSVVHVHGLDLVVDNSLYQRMFVPWVARNSTVIANSANTRNLAIERGCKDTQIEVLNPGTTLPDTSLLPPPSQLRKDLGIEAESVVLFVGRIVRRKGLSAFVKRAWPAVVAARPGTTLLVVGDDPENALRRDAEGAALRDAIGELDDDSVRFLGAIDDETLWRCYALADTLVFPLVDTPGDVEGFGMVAIEAAAFGTPTVAFPVGGVVDAVIDGVSGRLVPPGDYAAFSDAVVEMTHARIDVREQCRKHAERFSWAEHRLRLLALLEAGAEAPPGSQR